jgi:hypothetical protein
VAAFFILRILSRRRLKPAATLLYRDTTKKRDLAYIKQCSCKRPHFQISYNSVLCLRFSSSAPLTG